MIVLTLVWHRMSDGSESGEKISRTISAGALLAAVPTRHAVGVVRWVLDFQSGKHQKYVLRPARRRVCLPQGSYASAQEVGVGKALLVEWRASP